MNRLRVKLSLFFVLVLVIIPVSSCGGGDTENEANVMVFNTVLGGNPTTLDPIMFRDANANSVIAAIHEPLVRFDKTGYSWEPGLASHVERNEDSTVWTFTLRNNARWSDGTPITAEDVIYSFQRPLDPAMASPNVNDFFMFENAREIYTSRTEVEGEDPIEDIPFDELGVKDIGDNKIEFRLTKPIDYFIDYIRISYFAPVQKKAAQEHGALYGTDFDRVVSSGPFVLSTWNQEVSLILEKNDLYWDAKTVALDGVNINLAKDANTVMSLYDTGAIDFMTVDQTIADSGRYENVQEIRKLATQIIQFNSHEKIDGVEYNYFQSAKIREALALTFDREAYANDVVKQAKGAAYGLVPYGMRGTDGKDFREQQGDLVYDMGNFPGGVFKGKTYAVGKEGAVMRANDLLDEGLEELGKTRKEFETEAEFVLPNNPSTLNHAMAMQAMWKEHLGIEVMMKPLEMANLMPYIIGGTYQALIGGGPTGASYDAGEFLGFIYNEKQWDNEEYRTLWEKSLLMTGDERIEIIKELEKMACDAYLYIPVTFKYVNYVQDSTITGLRQFSVGLEYDYKYIVIGESL